MKRHSERSRYSAIAMCRSKIMRPSSGENSTERNSRGDGAAGSIASTSPDDNATVLLLVPKSRPRAGVGTLSIPARRLHRKCGQGHVRKRPDARTRAAWVASQEDLQMATFVLIHGSWHGAWCWY